MSIPIDPSLTPEHRALLLEMRVIVKDEFEKHEEREKEWQDKTSDRLTHVEKTVIRISTESRVGKVWSGIVGGAIPSVVALIYFLWSR